MSIANMRPVEKQKRPDKLGFIRSLYSSIFMIARRKMT
ncbi:hypothetical protein D2M30_2921 [Bacillus amyloliquefaciens]|nr:hypothetical protein D2M30_2921 [Bacillus amyloliquefaciens]